jgi:phosphate transport system substrate-binding protein
MMKSFTNLFVAFWVGTFGFHSFAKEKLSITGSSTVAPLILEIAKKFEMENPGVRIDVQTGGSSRGLADTKQGVAHIGMISRSLTDTDVGFVAHPVAKDGIAIIVNSNNKITNLSDAQIRDIFLGKIKDWKEVGGIAAPITVVNKADGRSTLELFLQYYKLKAGEVKASVIIGDNQQGIKTVAGNPNSIGYVSVGAAELEVSLGTKIKTLPINGVPASIASLRNNKFPLSRNLNLITLGEPKKGSWAKRFIKYSQSKKVEGLVEEQYFVPITH